MPKIALKEHLNEIVEIEFDDHTHGNVVELSFSVVWGKLISFTDRRVVVQQWESDGSKTDSAEYSVLARGAIVAVHRLRRMK